MLPAQQSLSLKRLSNGVSDTQAGKKKGTAIDQDPSTRSNRAICHALFMNNTWTARAIACDEDFESARSRECSVQFLGVTLYMGCAKNTMERLAKLCYGRLRPNWVIASPRKSARRGHARMFFSPPGCNVLPLVRSFRFMSIVC